MTRRTTLVLAAAAALQSSACADSSEDPPVEVADETGGADSGSGETSEPFVGPTASGCIDDVAPGHHVYECRGIVWDVEVPPQCHDAPCGLILDVHGFSMTGPIEDANTDMQASGREHGFVVLQPTAPGAVADWEPDAHDDKVYETLVLAIEAFDVDPTRVHMTGFSQGGFMTWRFACDYPEVFASVAPGGAADGCSSSGTPGCLLDDAAPNIEIDILYAHGTADAVVSFECFEPQVESVRSAYALGEGETLVDGEGYRRTRYVGASGAVLETLEYDYVAENAILDGHCFPGSDDLEGGLPGQVMPFACVPPNAFDWGEEAVAFFLAHPG